MSVLGMQIVSDDSNETKDIPSMISVKLIVQQTNIAILNVMIIKIEIILFFDHFIKKFIENLILILLCFSWTK